MKVKLFPINRYQMNAVEAYLEDMAKKGFFLQKLGYLAYYEKGEGKNVHYFVEPMLEKEEEPDYEKRLTYGECGWEYICTQVNCFHVYQAKSIEAEEIYTDPMAQGMVYEKFAKRMRNMNLLWIFMEILYLSLFFQRREIWKFPLFTEINQGGMLFSILFNLFIIMLVIEMGSCHHALKKRANELKAGIVQGKKTEYKAHYRKMVLGGAVIVTVVLLAVTGYCLGLQGRESTIAMEQTIPTLSLATMEEVKNYETKHDYLRNEKTLLSKEIYHIYEEISFEKEEKKENVEKKENIEIRSSLETDYYELRMAFLAKALFKEVCQLEDDRLTQEEPIVGKTMLERKEIATTSFQEAILFKQEGKETVVAYTKERVVVLRYEGESLLESKMDLLYEKVSTFSKAEMQ